MLSVSNPLLLVLKGRRSCLTRACVCRAQKVKELTANNVIVVSAIGNDGHWGTLNSPAEQPDVIGVAGVGEDGRVAAFSSRGMTTDELPTGYGRIGVDLAAPAVDLHAAHFGGACTRMTGTSVASPVVAGAVALLASLVPLASRWDIINPASMKQVLLEGSVPTGSSTPWEEGAGVLNLERSSAAMASYVPHASSMPSSIDLTDCGSLASGAASSQAWPWCTQPLFFSQIAVTANVTILNGVSVHGEVTSVGFEAGENGQLLDLGFEYGEVWPWTGWLSISISAVEASTHWQGIAEGTVVVAVRSDRRSSPASSSTSSLLHNASQTAAGSDKFFRSTTELLRIPVRVEIIPRPARSLRLLWDQFHSIQYPPGYIPADGDAAEGGPASSNLDWHGGEQPLRCFRCASGIVTDSNACRVTQTTCTRISESSTITCGLRGTSLTP